MDRNNAVINIYNDEELDQSNGSFKPPLSKCKTEDQTNDSSTKRGRCDSICNEKENTEEKPCLNENAHGRIHDTKFPYDNGNLDATKCQNIVSEYNVDENRELVIVKNTYDNINNISSQIEGQLDRAVGKHENRSETKTFVAKNYEANNKIIEEINEVNRSGGLNLDEGEPTKESFNQITSERDNRESDINSESKTIEKKKKEKLNTLATKTFVLPENEETKYCSLDTTERALADHEHVYKSIKKDSTDNEENKYYSLDKIGRALEDREHIYNNTKKDLKPETKVKQGLDRTNFDENYEMRNSFDDIEDERRQHGNNDDSYHETELKSIANHTAIENIIVECKFSDVNIINSYEAVNEENSDGQDYLIEDNEAIYERIRDENSLPDCRFLAFEEYERLNRSRRRKPIFQVLVVGILSIMLIIVIATVISLKNGNQQINDSNQKTHELSTKKAEYELTESCPHGWKLYKRHCYFFSLQNLLKWDQAKNECSRKGSHLVKVDNRAEDLWLQNNIENGIYWYG